MVWAEQGMCVGLSGTEVEFIPAANHVWPLLAEAQRHTITP